MSWEKRRFNWIPVDLAVELEYANIDLVLLQPVVVYKATIKDLSATGMLVYSGRQFRPASRFRVTFSLPDGKVQFYVIVKHTFANHERSENVYAHGMQIIGGTQEAVLSLVHFIKSHGVPHTAAKGPLVGLV